MERITGNDPVTQSANLVGDNLEHLRALMPEAFTEDKVDFDVLKQLLGGAVDGRQEKYGLNWHGKRQARQLALTPSTGTLLPCLEDSVDWETTQNLIIEGDNLEVLKLLQKNYAGKVKLIYIDPPYNTGHDFVYPDDFADNMSNYLTMTGQIDGNGQRVSSNTEASGRYHTDWLNMLYSRLKLARNLLRPSGVIFISIDDNEAASLRYACDEIFGEENFFAQIPWQSRTSMQNDTDLSIQHEYLVVYARNRRTEHRRLKDSNIGIWSRLESFAAYPMPLDQSRYDNPDNDPRGIWKADPFDAPNVRPRLTYAIVNPKTSDEHWPPPGRCWRTEESKYQELLADGRIVFGRTGDARPQLKVFYEERKDFGEVPSSWFAGDSHGTVTNGTQELQSLFHAKSPFPFPKPTKLLQAIIRMATKDNDIVMDFFAGSGTTGHAVLAQNAVDSGSRRYILVQLPELLHRDNSEQAIAADFCETHELAPNIAEITKERLRRAAQEISRANPGFQSDMGFRVFKLATTNIRAWEPDREKLQQTLEQAVEHLRADRTQQDILYELILKFGLDLASRIVTREFVGKQVHAVGEGVLLACLATKIDSHEIEELVQGIVAWHSELSPAGESNLVFRDSAFTDDVAKTNLAAILQQHGLKNVRSI